MNVYHKQIGNTVVASATGVGAMASTFTPATNIEIVQINLHLSAASATSENFVINLDSTTGAAYDVNVYTKDMNTVKDIILPPSVLGGLILLTGDSLVSTWTNTNARTWGLQIFYKKRNL